MTVLNRSVEGRAEHPIRHWAAGFLSLTSNMGEDLSVSMQFPPGEAPPSSHTPSSAPPPVPPSPSASHSSGAASTGTRGSG